MKEVPMHTPLSRVAEVRISGPLAPYLSGFKSALAVSGYTPLSTVNQMRLMGHLSRWLEAKRVCVSDLTTERVEEFLAARRADGYTALLSRQGLTPLLNFLSTRGKLPAAPLSAPKTGTDLVLASFHRNSAPYADGSANNSVKTCSPGSTARPSTRAPPTGD
jgi:integrase/recombinase XerD